MVLKLLVALKSFSTACCLGRGCKSQSNAPRQGDSLQYQVNLKFEAIFSTDKKVNNREATCAAPVWFWHWNQETVQSLASRYCHGTEAWSVLDTNTSWNDAPSGDLWCHGRGQKLEPLPNLSRNRAWQLMCSCLKIPAGVWNWSTNCLSGQSEAGFNGGPYGDLYVVVQNGIKWQIWRRDGSTGIISPISISLSSFRWRRVEIPTQLTVMWN